MFFFGFERFFVSFEEWFNIKEQMKNKAFD